PAADGLPPKPAFSDANWVGVGDLPGPNDAVLAAVLDSSGNLYIGGDFTRVGDVAANRIAKWNGSNWSELGSGINGHVYALAVLGSDLYAGGYFRTAGGNPANRIAKWNGSSWSALGSGIGTAEATDYSTVETLAVLGNELVAG